MGTLFQFVVTIKMWIKSLLSFLPRGGGVCSSFILPGFTLGDGEWALGGRNGPVQTEKVVPSYINLRHSLNLIKVHNVDTPTITPVP